MEKDEFIPKVEEETPESKVLNIIINEFDKILRKTDRHYDEKIFFNVSYNMSGDYYKINILPSRDGFDSKKYFIKHFEGKIKQGKLDKFLEGNNIGTIAY